MSDLDEVNPNLKRLSGWRGELDDEGSPSFKRLNEPTSLKYNFNNKIKGPTKRVKKPRPNRT